MMQFLLKFAFRRQQLTYNKTPSALRKYKRCLFSKSHKKRPSKLTAILCSIHNPLRIQQIHLLLDVFYLAFCGFDFFLNIQL